MSNLLRQLFNFIESTIFATHRTSWESNINTGREILTNYNKTVTFRTKSNNNIEWNFEGNVGIGMVVYKF